jgi:hypothetical protein
VLNRDQRYKRSLFERSQFRIYMFAIFLLLYFFDFLGYFIRSTLHLNLPPTGVIAYMLTVPLLLLTLIDLQKQGVAKKVWVLYSLFLIFIILCLVSAAASNNSEFLDYYYVILYLVYFSVGYYLYYLYSIDYKETDKLTRLIYKLTIILPFILFFFIVTNTASGAYVLDFSGEHVNYLRLAEAYVLISIIAMVLAKKQITMYVIITVSIISLFLINSRSALLGYIIAIVLLQIYSKGLKPILGLSIFVLILSEIMSYLPEVMKGVEESRIGRLIYSTDTDTSLSVREEVMALGMEIIYHNPITGEHNGHLKYGEGAYMHNILSYWAQYGFFAFSALCLLLILTVKNSYVNVKTAVQHDRISKIAFIYLAYCTFGVIASKAYVYNEIYLAIGLTISIIVNEKKGAGRYRYIPS